MRDIHTRMLGAVLEGGGLRGLAELAAEEAGGPVAIVLPARGLAAASTDDIDVEALATFAGGRLRKSAAARGDEVIAEHPVEAGRETIGYVLALRTSSNSVSDLELDRDAGGRVPNLTFAALGSPTVRLGAYSAPRCTHTPRHRTRVCS